MRKEITPCQQNKPRWEQTRRIAYTFYHIKRFRNIMLEIH